MEDKPPTTNVSRLGESPDAGEGGISPAGLANGPMPGELPPAVTPGAVSPGAVSPVNLSPDGQTSPAAEPAGMQCPGCDVDGECVASGAPGPTECLICDPARARDAWSFNDGVSCDDGQFCSVEDVCQAGVCSGQPRSCDDGIACNGVSTCDEGAAACTPFVNLCDALALCGSDGRCVTTCSGCVIGGTCVEAGAARAGNPCFVCDPARDTSDYVAALGKACGAGPSACSQQDSCDAAGTCLPNDVPAGAACGDSRSSACDASDACDGRGACASRVAANGTLCSDGQACTLNDSCRAGVCVSGAAVSCADGNVCDPGSGQCVCQEGQPRCNGSVLEICSGGSFDELQDCGGGRCNAAAARCECQDDSDPNTTLVQDAKFGCGFSRSIGAERWVSFDSGVELDPSNGFAWVRQGFLTVADTTSTCAGLNIGGVTGWRLPTINEVRSLISGCAATDACPLSQPSCLTMSCGACDSCLGSQGPNAGQYCRPIVPICTTIHTASRCTDCPNTSFEWIYGPVNGNFLPSDPTDRITGYCFHSGF